MVIIEAIPLNKGPIFFCSEKQCSVVLPQPDIFGFEPLFYRIPAGWPWGKLRAPVFASENKAGDSTYFLGLLSRSC